MEAYLDNSATTKCFQEVKEVVVKTMIEDYGNPSAMHLKGVKSEQYIKTALTQIATTLKVDQKDIYFTSGGTESNNWALIGVAMANKRQGMHIITTAIEHPSIAGPIKYLEEQGFSITRLGVDSNGEISLEELENSLCEETILVSTMYVNNEMGALLPIEKIGKILKNKNPNIIYHVDAIQAYGKFQIHPRKMGVDLLSVSGHKIHGPKGVGFLYINEKIKIKPLILGGGQQKGMRSGTDNVPGIAGLGVAAHLSYEKLEEKVQRITELKNYFLEELLQLERITIQGNHNGNQAPHIINVAFLGVRSEVLLHTLEEKQIYLSAGSACSSHKRSGSPTLTAMGVDKNILESAVRFSLCEETTKEEIDYTISQLKEVLPILRKYARQ